MEKRFDRCILHIGTEKTGSTTLQTFLAENRNRLIEDGFFVPSTLSPYKAVANHERLTTISLNSDKLNDDLRRSAGVTSSADIILHREKVDVEFKAELKQLTTEPLVLLLSNEHCHSRLVTKDEVQHLKDFLSEFTESFQIVVYLRPQHELAVSLYDQALKAGYTDISVIPTFAAGAPRWVERQYFDYHDLLSRWEAVFGYSALTPVIFSRNSMKNASIVDDFGMKIGCDISSYQRPQNKNTSISEEFQAALNALNRLSRANPGIMSQQVRARTISIFQKLSKGQGRLPTRTEANHFYALFNDANESVRQRFFQHRHTLFDVDFSEYPEASRVDFSEADALSRVLISVIGN